MQNTLVQLSMFEDQNLNPDILKDDLLLRLDFHVRIYRLLAEEQVSMEADLLSSLKQYASLKNCGLTILSLKTSKVFTPVTTDETLQQHCEQLPTLGTMHNGSLLILHGFYPKIESGYTLSDFLEEQVDEKYFLSEKAVEGLMKHKEHPRGFETIHEIESTEERERDQQQH